MTDVNALKALVGQYDLSTRDNYRRVRKEHPDLQLPDDKKLAKEFGSFKGFKIQIGLEEAKPITQTVQPEPQKQPDVDPHAWVEASKAAGATPVEFEAPKPEAPVAETTPAELVEAVEKNASKNDALIQKIRELSSLFDCGSRASYLAFRKEHPELNLPGRDTILKMFGTFAELKKLIEGNGLIELVAPPIIPLKIIPLKKAPVAPVEPVEPVKKEETKENMATRLKKLFYLREFKSRDIYLDFRKKYPKDNLPSKSVIDRLFGNFTEFRHALGLNGTNGSVESHIEKQESKKSLDEIEDILFADPKAKPFAKKEEPKKLTGKYDDNYYDFAKEQVDAWRKQVQNRREEMFGDYDPKEYINGRKIKTGIW
jgi:hypothetical protein